MHLTYQVAVDVSFVVVCGLCNALGIGGKKLPKSTPKWDAFVCFHPLPLPQWEILNNALQSRCVCARAMQSICVRRMAEKGINRPCRRLSLFVQNPVSPKL
jgi:hypothetical protein